MRPSRIADSCSRPASAMMTIGRSRIEDRAGPGRVLPAEADVLAAGQMRRGELRRLARVEDLRARRAAASSTWSSVSGFSPSASDCVQRRTLLGVQHGVVDEVRRRVGLIGGDQLDERLAAHRLQRVVRLAAARRWSRTSPCPAPCRTATRRRGRDRPGWRRAAPAASGAASRRAGSPRSAADQPSEARRSGRPTSPTKSVSPVSTACGRVSLRSRSNTSSEIDSGVWPGRLERLQPHAAERRSCRRRPAAGTRTRPWPSAPRQIGGAGAIAQLEVAGQEVGVQVRQHHVRDPQPVRLRRRPGTARCRAADRRPRPRRRARRRSRYDAWARQFR